MAKDNSAKPYLWINKHGDKFSANEALKFIFAEVFDGQYEALISQLNTSNSEADFLEDNGFTKVEKQ